jgi:excinuclease UvrABC nuclease subunit
MAKDPAFLFYPNDWQTPNTYDRHFANPPDKSGIYLIVLPRVNEIIKKMDYEILYVGSAKSLKVRYAGHEVKRMLTEFYGYVQFYFKLETNYREVEKQLIKQIQPKYNKQWR